MDFQDLEDEEDSSQRILSSDMVPIFSERNSEDESYPLEIFAGFCANTDLGMLLDIPEVGVVDQEMPPNELDDKGDSSQRILSSDIVPIFSERNSEDKSFHPSEILAGFCANTHQGMSSGAAGGEVVDQEMPPNEPKSKRDFSQSIQSAEMIHILSPIREIEDKLFQPPDIYANADQAMLSDEPEAEYDLDEMIKTWKHSVQSKIDYVMSKQPPGRGPMEFSEICAFLDKEMLGKPKKEEAPSYIIECDFFKRAKDKSQPSNVCSIAGQDMPSSKPDGKRESSHIINKYQPSIICSNADQGMPSGEPDVKGESSHVINKYQPSNICSNAGQGMPSAEPQGKEDYSHIINKSQPSNICLNACQRISSGKQKGKKDSLHVIKSRPSNVCLNAGQRISSVKSKRKRDSSYIIEYPFLRSCEAKSQPSNADQGMSSGSYPDDQEKNTTEYQNSQVRVLSGVYNFKKKRKNKNTPEVPRRVSFMVGSRRPSKHPIPMFNSFYLEDLLKAFSLHNTDPFLAHIKDSPILVHISKEIALFINNSLRANVKPAKMLTLLHSAHNLLLNPFAISGEYIRALSKRHPYIRLMTSSAVTKKFHSYAFLAIHIVVDVFTELLIKHLTVINCCKKMWKGTVRDLYKSLKTFFKKIKNPKHENLYWTAISFFLSVNIENIPLNLLFQFKKYCWYIFEKCLKHPQSLSALRIWNIFVTFCDQNALNTWDFLTDVFNKPPDLHRLLLGNDFREIEQKHNCYCTNYFKLPIEYPLMTNYIVTDSEYFHSDIRPRPFYSTRDFFRGQTSLQVLERKKIPEKLIPIAITKHYVIYPNFCIMRKVFRRLSGNNAMKVSHEINASSLSDAAMDIAVEGKQIPITTTKHYNIHRNFCVTPSGKNAMEVSHEMNASSLSDAAMDSAEEKQVPITTTKHYPIHQNFRVIHKVIPSGNNAMEVSHEINASSLSDAAIDTAAEKKQIPITTTKHYPNLQNFRVIHKSFRPGGNNAMEVPHMINDSNSSNAAMDTAAEKKQIPITTTKHYPSLQNFRVISKSFRLGGNNAMEVSHKINDSNLSDAAMDVSVEGREPDNSLLRKCRENWEKLNCVPVKTASSSNANTNVSPTTSTSLSSQQILMDWKSTVEAHYTSMFAKNVLSGADKCNYPKPAKKTPEGLHPKPAKKTPEGLHPKPAKKTPEGLHPKPAKKTPEGLQPKPAKKTPEGLQRKDSKILQEEEDSEFERLSSNFKTIGSNLKKINAKLKRSRKRK